MNFYNYQISKNIFSLNRYVKRALAILVDIMICIITFWLALYLRLEEFILFKNLNLTPVILSILIAIPIFWIFGLYRTLFRYAGLSIFFTISISTFVYGLIYFFIISVYGLENIPRSIGIIQPVLLFVGIIASRFLLKYLLTGTFQSLINKKKKRMF